MPTPQDRDAARRAQRPVKFALGILVVIVALLVAAGAVAAFRVYELGNHRFIDQAGPFFAVSEDLSVELLNEETAVRGYVITSDPATLAPYRRGRKYSQLELGILQKDASFDRSIPPHVAAARAEVKALDAYFAKEIALVRSGPAGQKVAEQRVVAGKKLFDRFRVTSLALIGDAGNLITRSHREQRSTLVMWWIILGLAGFAAAAIAAGLYARVPRRLYDLFREERRARRDAEQGADAAHALAHVGEAVVLLDRLGEARYWNPPAATLFGLQPGARTSPTLMRVLDEFHSAGPTPGARPVTIDGREIWLVIAETEFEDGRVVVFRNVSDDVRLERLRSEFVATAAHELRTPLAAVYGAVRTLRQQERVVPPEVREQFLEMIENESERLRLVMDQLLVSAQIDASDLHLQRQDVDVVAMCRSVVDSTAARVPEGIQLAVDGDSGPVALSADADRLRQVVANLIDNAIKYSPGGGRVDVRVSSNGAAGSIEVEDHGLGIPAHEQQRIFEKFYRLDPSMTKGVGGSGLGLYISRELVRQMGGTLTVSSRYGEGSTFTVTLPLA
jgi:signal transduction histidine kinase